MLPNISITTKKDKNMKENTYCVKFYPQRLNWECWTDCNVEREAREQECRDNLESDDCDECNFFNDDETD